VEDPIRFDIWGTVIPTRREAALIAARERGGYVSEIELRKAIGASCRSKIPVRVAKSVSYSLAMDFMRHSSASLHGQALYQEGFTPEDQTAYCEKHCFHFGGCLGCHVCRGFYVE